MATMFIDRKEVLKLKNESDKTIGVNVELKRIGKGMYKIIKFN